MSIDTKRRVWQSPWGYPESIAIVVGLLLIGLVLQIACGSFNFFLLANPVNFITGLVLFVLSVILGFNTHKSSFARWIAGVPMSVTLILSILFLTIIMGLTPQVAEGSQSNMLLGFDSMTSNWSFVIIYSITLLSLGAIVIRKLRNLRVKDAPFMLQHFGLWLFLAASGLGYADMERYIMYVEEGETQWRVYDTDGSVKELPIAIKLNDFDMEVYPPKLAVIERSTGAVQPENKPEYFQIDPHIESGKIADWEIEVEEYIHEAVRGADSTYRNVPMPGATPAIKIRASREGEEHQGWVCGGNQLQFYMALIIDERFSIVMTPAEPRKYSSDIEVYTQDGDAEAAVIEVNKPLQVGSWKIYQYGYDNNAGSLSRYSSFELVYDAWLPLVYAGVLFMILGMLCMVVQGRKRIKRDSNLK